MFSNYGYYVIIIIMLLLKSYYSLRSIDHMENVSLIATALYVKRQLFDFLKFLFANCKSNFVPRILFLYFFTFRFSSVLLVLGTCFADLDKRDPGPGSGQKRHRTWIRTKETPDLHPDKRDRTWIRTKETPDLHPDKRDTGPGSGQKG